jgi:predicted TIM-barrel fold metal-dependent hydrolase
MHIFSPSALSESKLSKLPYDIPKATIPQAMSLLSEVAPKMCIVQPSIYGSDNTVTLDGLKELREKGGGGCAVVELDVRNVTGEMMEEFHKNGVRGVR